jgi:hypothetical protein
MMMSPLAISSVAATFADQLELFFGNVNPAEATIHARWQCSGDVQSQSDIPQYNPADWKLSGQIIGPECLFAQTLTSQVPFINRSEGNALWAGAVIPDPCFWTPELPFLYRAEVQLHGPNQRSAACQRTIGIRRLGIRDRWLYFEGKRFILRGGQFNISDDWSLSAILDSNLESVAAFARETWSAVVAPLPGDQLCQFASSQGMLLVADLLTAGIRQGKALVAELRRLARWSAVGIVVLPIDADLPSNVRTSVPNLLLAQWISADMPFNLAPWAQLVFAEVGNLREFANKVSTCVVPVAAVCRPSQSTTGEQVRAACDNLQSQLAPYGDFAGYVV